MTPANPARRETHCGSRHFSWHSSASRPCSSGKSCRVECEPRFMQIERGRRYISIVPSIVGIVVAVTLSVSLLFCDLVDPLSDLGTVRRQIDDAIRELHRQQLPAVA